MPASGAVAVRRGRLVVAGGLLAATVVTSLGDVVLASVPWPRARARCFQPLKASSYIVLSTIGMVTGAVGWAIVRKRSEVPRRR